MARVAPVDSAKLSSLEQDEFCFGWLRDLAYEGCTAAQIAEHEREHGVDWWRHG